VAGTIVYVLVGLAALYSITIFADLTDRAAWIWLFHP